MAKSSNEKLFRTKVLPIMDKVMADLRHKQAEEIGRHTRSLSYIMAGAAGPDGGMSAQAASLDSLRYTGKWNSKHTEDYINMVKAELKKQHITVTPEIEKMMINKMIKDEVPKSSIEYIMRKAATNTIFYLPQAMSKSPLENHITEQAEKRYNPSALEKGTGYALGATADFLSMGGFGGGWSSAAKFVGVDVGLNTALDHFGGSTEYTPAGTKVTAEGKIYHSFTADNIIRSASWNSSELKKNIMFCTIGVDFGGNKSSTAFTCTAFTKNFRECVIVREKRIRQEIDPTKLEKLFCEFAGECQREYPVYTAYCDSAEQVLIRGLKKAVINQFFYFIGLQRNDSGIHRRRVGR